LALAPGDTVLLPASLQGAVTAVAPMTWLEVRLP
jgi:hypothetical protein